MIDDKFITFNGDPIVGRTPLRVRMPPNVPVEAYAETIGLLYRKFKTTIAPSIIPINTAVYRTPDGSMFRFVSAPYGDVLEVAVPNRVLATPTNREKPLEIPEVWKQLASGPSRMFSWAAYDMVEHKLYIYAGVPNRQRVPPARPVQIRTYTYGPVAVSDVTRKVIQDYTQTLTYTQTTISGRYTVVTPSAVLSLGRNVVHDRHAGDTSIVTSYTNSSLSWVEDRRVTYTVPHNDMDITPPIIPVTVTAVASINGGPFEVFSQSNGVPRTFYTQGTRTIEYSADGELGYIVDNTYRVTGMSGRYIGQRVSWAEANYQTPIPVERSIITSYMYGIQLDARSDGLVYEYDVRSNRWSESSYSWEQIRSTNGPHTFTRRVVEGGTTRFESIVRQRFVQCAISTSTGPLDVTDGKKYPNTVKHCTTLHIGDAYAGVVGAVSNVTYLFGGVRAYTQALPNAYTQVYSAGGFYYRISSQNPYGWEDGTAVSETPPGDVVEAWGVIDDAVASCHGDLWVLGSHMPSNP